MRLVPDTKVYITSVLKRLIKIPFLEALCHLPTDKFVRD